MLPQAISYIPLLPSPFNGKPNAECPIEGRASAAVRKKWIPRGKCHSMRVWRFPKFSPSYTHCVFGGGFAKPPRWRSGFSVVR